MLDDHLQGRTYIVGDTYTIADMSAMGLDRARRLCLQEERPSTRWPPIPTSNVWWRPLMRGRQRRAAKQVGKDLTFKTENDEEAKRALFSVELSACQLRAKR